MNKIALTVAIFAGILAVILLNEYHKNLIESEGEITTEIMISAVDLEAGTLLRPEHVRRREIPVKYLEDTHIPAGAEDVFFRSPIQRTITKNQPLHSTWFQDLEPAAMISPVTMGRRAISIPVDEVSGVAGLLRPGAYVDILGMFSVPVGARGREEEIELVSYTLFQDVYVLAVDSLTRAGSAIDRGYRTVTIEATPAMAEVLVFALTQGKITFSLRNPNDSETAQLESVRWEEFREMLVGIQEEHEVTRIEHRGRDKRTIPR